MEDKIMMDIIHENYRKNQKKFYKKVEESKLTVLDVILLNVGVDTFFIGFAFLISAIENMRF